MCGGSSLEALPPSADDIVADASVVQQLQVEAFVFRLQGLCHQFYGI
jgi:hypothetical protein